jgi:hypothetical protein
MPQVNFLQQGQGLLTVLSHALGCDDVAIALKTATPCCDTTGAMIVARPAPGTYTMEGLTDHAAELIRGHIANSALSREALREAA